MIRSRDSANERRALIVTNMWPTVDDPAFGIFVRDQVEALERRLIVAAHAGRRGAAEIKIAGIDVAGIDSAENDVADIDFGGTDVGGIDVAETDVADMDIAGIDVFTIDGRKNRLAYLVGVLRLRRILSRPDREYVLVHAHHVLAGLAAILAGARRPGRALVVTHHGIEVLEGWQAPLCRWVSARADRTLVTSPALAERLGGVTDVVPCDIVPCGIDLRRFRPGDRAAARAELGLPARGALVAWAGTDRPEKRLWLARAAVERLGEVADDATEFESRPQLLEISGRPHADVPTWLRAADALVLTSTAEGSPLVVREALACGLPVVSTDVGDVRALLEGLPGCAIVGTPDATSTRSATAARPDDALIQPLADALERALAFSATGAAVDADAVLADYDADAIADRILGIWRDAIEMARATDAMAGRS